MDSSNKGLELSAQSIFDTIDAIKKIETLSDTEKSENIKKANELLRNIIKDRQCNICKNVCNNINACEFCIRNYLVGRFEKWTSEHEEIDEWIENCQKNLLRPDYIIEWIPYSNLQDIQYLTEGGIYHKMKALWTEGRYSSWDVKRQELKRFGPHYVTIKNVSINNQEQSLQEINAHLKLTSTMSPVIRIYGLTKDGNNDYMIITENIAYNLKSYLQDNIGMLTWIQKYRILQDILESLGSVHNNELIHGDLHSGIVRYSVNREIWLIGDLRFCRPIEKPSNVNYGTVQYIAPEVLKKEGQMTISSDIYSFAMIMWEVSTGRQPFDGQKQPKLSDDIINGNRPEIMNGTPSRYSELMRKCWSGDPSERPSLVDVQNEIKGIINNYYKGSQEEQKEMMSIDYLKAQLVHTNKFAVKPNVGKNISIEIINYDQIKQEYSSDRIDKISFATVSSKRVALKTLQIDRSDKTNEKKGTLLIEILQKHISELSHIYNSTNIVEFLGIGIQDENKLFLVMPLANNDNLRNYIKNNKLSFHEKIEVAKGITSGIKILHDNKIVHGNINPTNILIFDRIAKIANLPLPFENKEFKDNKDLYIVDILFDNIGYIDPNSFLKGYNGSYKKSESADVYSLGTLLWEIMSERVPYQDEGILQLIKKIKAGYREADIPHIPDEYKKLYDEYKNLYTKCWHEDSLVRPAIEDVNERLKYLISLLKE